MLPTMEQEHEEADVNIKARIYGFFRLDWLTEPNFQLILLIFLVSKASYSQSNVLWQLGGSGGGWALGWGDRDKEKHGGGEGNERAENNFSDGKSSGKAVLTGSGGWERECFH